MSWGTCARCANPQEHGARCAYCGTTGPTRAVVHRVQSHAAARRADRAAINAAARKVAENARELDEERR